VIDFYALFYPKPVGETFIHVCADPACALGGSDELLEQLSAGSVPGVTVERSPCLGLCEHAPALLVNGQPVAGAAGLTREELLAGKGNRPDTILGGDLRLLTANCGAGQTTSLSEYRQRGGYQALRKALEMTPQAVIDEIKASGLVGRGGAAFPTGVKWEGALRAPGTEKYVICNGDEAEPGTFKDRVLMTDDPHSVLEGLIIAAYATGAQKGYIYIRGEYRQPFEKMREAVEAAHAEGLLGERILGADFSLDVELRLGAGAYICGEETALFESIEGKRGFPRIKPPFPTTHGLFGKPTAINNVETLANVPLILRLGASEYRKIGTEKSPGPKLFCVSGDVARPGLYEVAFGATIRHLLYDLAGGLRPGRRFKAALIGGAAGAFAGEEDLDVRLSFEDLRAAGLPLGSGVITVFDETRDLRDVLLRLAHFFRDESCGKCYPCQIGTQRQFEVFERIAAGKALPGDRERLEDVGWTMSDASLCGLGQTAASAVLSAIKRWPELFQPAVE
jgi:NADH-quinone oxidoreductase subunit F